MKAIFVLGALLGAAIVGSAQTAQAPDTQWGMVVNDATQAGALTHFKGGVAIQIGTIRINADEADFNRETGQLDLLGNVRMLTKPAR
jgi:lipopolysaccharide assembly outer membrane protein LptD (OstA)